MTRQRSTVYTTHASRALFSFSQFDMPPVLVDPLSDAVTLLLIILYDVAVCPLTYCVLFATVWKEIRLGILSRRSHDLMHLVLVCILLSLIVSRVTLTYCSDDAHDFHDLMILNFWLNNNPESRQPKASRQLQSIHNRTDSATYKCRIGPSSPRKIRVSAGIRTSGRLHYASNAVWPYLRRWRWGPIRGSKQRQKEWNLENRFWIWSFFAWAPTVYLALMIYLGLCLDKACADLCLL